MFRILLILLLSRYHYIAPQRIAQKERPVAHQTVTARDGGDCVPATQTKPLEPWN